MNSTIRCFCVSAITGLAASMCWCSPSHAVTTPLSQLLFERTLSGYQARGKNVAIRFGSGEIDLHARGAASLSMRMAGKARQVEPVGADPSSAKIYYRVGPQREWTDHDAFGKVVYPSVYAGVNLIFSGAGDQLEYDFDVQPGADPSVIQMKWDGARKLALDPGGDLTVFAREGEIRWRAPQVFQTDHGKQEKVSGRFRLLGGDRVGFDIGVYDHSRPLVIDPFLVFSTYLGGSAMDRSRGIAVDAAGDVYVAGFSESMDFPVTTAAYQTGWAGATSNGVSGDAFLAKYSSDGSVIFITYLGGGKDDIGMGVALDPAGNPYVTGYTNSLDFPTTPGAYQTVFGGYYGDGFILVGGDAFISEFSPDGKKLLYSSYLGGSGDDFGFGIALDASGDVYVTGTTLSSNFPVSANAYQKQVRGSGGQENFPLFGNGLSTIVGGDVFVTKLNPANPPATAVVYSTFIGGSYDDVASSIFVDSSGNAYVGGYTLSPDYPVTPGAYQRKWGGAEANNYFFILGDGFISKLSPDGSALLFSTYIGGSGDDWVSGLAADSMGNVIATGSTTSRNFPVTAGATQAAFRGPFAVPLGVDMFFGDAYLLKLKADGSSLIFSTYFGGSGDECAQALTTDAAGNIYIAGWTNSADFPVSAGAVQRTLAGPGFIQRTLTFGDAFLAQFNSSGSPTYATYLGGSQNDAAFSLAVSSSGTAYLSGTTKSTDFPTQNAAQAKNASLNPGYSVAQMTAAANVFVSAISGFGAAGSGPFISSVVNTTGGSTVIAQNTWIEVHGQNLAPDKRIWQPSDFVNGQMPTSLDGVSVTVNGKPAFVYYISSTQVNVLTPLDSTTGTVQVQLKNGSAVSASVPVQMQTTSPGFFQFSHTDQTPSPYVAAVHLNGPVLYVGPTTLYAGQSGPAHPNEEIAIFANGFGQTTPPVVNGSATQYATLPTLPDIKIAGVEANVIFAGVVSPGEYQFNVIIPGSLSPGDYNITASYNDASTQAGAMISISN